MLCCHRRVQRLAHTGAAFLIVVFAGGCASLKSTSSNRLPISSRSPARMRLSRAWMQITCQATTTPSSRSHGRSTAQNRTSYAASSMCATDTASAKIPTPNAK